MTNKLNRRSVVKMGLAAAMAGLFMASASSAVYAAHTPANKKKHKLVIQLNDKDWKHAMFVLGNLKNIYKGVKGPQNLEAELVVFGPALKNFTKKNMKPQVKARLEALQLDGLRFGACGNTMKRFKISMDELPQGSTHLKQGGLVRIMEAQEEGYTYARP